MVSDIPFGGPIGAVRVGRVDGKFITQPTHQQMPAQRPGPRLRRLRARHRHDRGFRGRATRGGFQAGARVRAAGSPDRDQAAEGPRRPSLEAERNLPLYAVKPELVELAYSMVSDRIEGAIYRPSKVERYAATGALKKEVEAAIKEKYPDATSFDISSAFSSVEIKAFRAAILDPQAAQRQPRARGDSSPLRRSRPAAARARFLALRPRRDAGALPRDPRPQRRGAGSRRLHRRRDDQALHPSLQTSRPSRSARPAASAA